jgi:hypothetical protein
MQRTIFNINHEIKRQYEDTTMPTGSNTYELNILFPLLPKKGGSRLDHGVVLLVDDLLKA